MAQNGASNWHPNSGHIIGTGWNFRLVFSGGNGIIYAIDSQDNLFFYKDLARDGTRYWASSSSALIGEGWRFDTVIADR